MFWITDLGLASHLATMWSGHGCAEDFHDSSICVPFEELDLADARTNISYRWYYMMLVAGVVLAACELLVIDKSRDGSGTDRRQDIMDCHNKSPVIRMVETSIQQH